MTRPTPILRLALVGRVLVLAADAARAADLHALRAQRRAAVRTAALAADKAAGGVPFGLLVIPVDFSDARLPAGWQPGAVLGPRLEGDGATLDHYFAVASGGACDLKVVLAPLVSLPGARRDYSDLGYNGFTRTRRLATEAITAVRDLGFPLRRADNDGPDGVAGTADDDGVVDGVLILHAGVGLENDLENGLIQPLQYYLDPGVAQDGVTASFYAVAAMQSGLGIWAHETAHLMGLEERYDLRYSASGASELHSRGGLGRFSLMAAGAWGTGGGDGPALPDAYSRAQLGWCGVVDLPLSGPEQALLAPVVDDGIVHRVWTEGRPVGEYYLLEVRAPRDGFDAAVPAGGLVISHVDESVAEGAWAVGDAHLRVRLVEADGDDGLADGRDEGSAADIFPGTTGADAFGPGTLPSSDGYRGPSQVAITGIAPGATGVAYAVRATDGLATRVALNFSAGSPRLDLRIIATGDPFTRPTVTVAAAYPPLGAWAAGGTSVDLELGQVEPGTWAPLINPAWVPDPGLPAGAATRFLVTVADGAWTADPVSRSWVWVETGDVLDFAASWPGAWTIDRPEDDTGTTWHRWDDRSAAVPTVGGHVLACTATEDSTGAAWPVAHYDNNAHATLTSGPLPAGVTGVRLVHACVTEQLTPGVFMDGGTAAWVGPDGAVVAAEPVDGWPGRVDPQSLAALHGRGAWGGPGLLAANLTPAWRMDVLPVPAGQGPWRLQLEFASNTRGWDYRGWIIAEAAPLTGELPTAAVPIAWDGARLTWTWPALPSGPATFHVERADGDDWPLVLAVTPVDEGGGTFRLEAATLLPLLEGPARTRHALRVSGPWGDAADAVLASLPVIVFADGGDGAPITFSLPWPNPAVDAVNVLVGVPDGAAAVLRVFDLAGRLVHTERLAAGETLVRWDGADDRGRRVAAGTYILQLDGPDGRREHKVVLLH
ncbi:MAG TPA: FlgD immunoglobulin-like domain containing protein [Candidatus Krumholzibacteria bacterium]|nr:FlgD immunoglobulin-like domain containing protein [Candidatus Krumholzibacteria bacterium]